MTPATLSAIRTVLGPMTSEAKCREVYEAVLLSARAPEPNVTVRGWNFVNADLVAGHQDAMNKLYGCFIDALLAE